MVKGGNFTLFNADWGAIIIGGSLEVGELLKSRGWWAPTQITPPPGWQTLDTITVVFDQRNRTIEFIKNSISQGIAFTADEIHKGKARFLIEMGTPEDSVTIL